MWDSTSPGNCKISPSLALTCDLWSDQEKFASRHPSGNLSVRLCLTELTWLDVSGCSVMQMLWVDFFWTDFITLHLLARPFTAFIESRAIFNHEWANLDDLVKLMTSSLPSSGPALSGCGAPWRWVEQWPDWWPALWPVLWPCLQNLHQRIRPRPGPGALHITDRGTGLGPLHVQGALHVQPGGHQVLRAGHLQWVQHVRPLSRSPGSLHDIGGDANPIIYESFFLVRM